MKKIILTDILLLQIKDKKHEKKLDCKFFRINTSKKGYDANYEICRMQTFISKFKNRQLKKLEKESNK